MRRQVPSQKLRGVDQVTLEVQIGDLIAKPLGQVNIENIADLMALAELDTAPPTISRRLAGYAERIARAVTDLPNGQQFADFAEDLSGVAAARVPMSLRAALVEERGRPSRTAAEVELLDGLLASWEGEEAIPFLLSETAQVEVKVAPEARRREEARMRAPAGARTAGSVTRTPAATGSTRKTGAKAKRTPKPKPVVDPARAAWIRQIVLERLSGRSEGLQEAVLFAAIRHRAREKFPNLGVQEITKVLKEMSEQGTVRHSARRWSVAGRNW